MVVTLANGSATPLTAILIALVFRHPAQTGAGTGTGTGTDTGRSPTPASSPEVRPFIGIEVHEQNTPSGAGGCVIYAVIQGSPASRAGLKAGDVVTSLAGAAITTCTSVFTIEHGLHVGDTAPIRYVQGSTTHTAEITLSGTTAPVSPSPTGS
jgi:predicted metalloprotease with PDZ domain